MRAIGFQAGLRGDAVISTVAARAFKQVYPDAHLTFALHQQFIDILPLFYQHPYFDNFHLWQEYDLWPGQADKEYLTRTKYDIVFNAMPKRHNESSWWLTENQCENVCSVYNLPIPSNTQPILNPWFAIDERKDYVAFNYVGSWPKYPNEKSFNLDKAQRIVNMVRKMGYKVLQLGASGEPALENTDKLILSLFETVKTMLGCRALIGIDSFLTWAASAYSFPCVSSYSSRYYGEHIASIQPKNQNARYLSAFNLNDIDDGQLEETIRMVLA